MISIIVPIYNTEKYLRECLDSILAQTYTNIEIILVDDGSTDRSFEICREYKNRDIRVKAYHKDNKGVSDTRNFGIEHANGKYISFCDSDDKITPDLYQTLIDVIEEHEVDRVISGYMYLYDDGRLLYRKPRIVDGKYEANSILQKMIDDGTLSGFLFSGVNNSLFKKDIICCNNIRFNSKIRYNEDSLFSLQYMLCSKSIYSIQSKHTYYYRQHSNSSTSKRTAENIYEFLHKALYSMELDKMNIDFETQMKRRTVTEALWQILDICAKENSIKAIRNIRKVLNDKKICNCLNVINTHELNIYKKIYYILIKLKISSLLYLLSNKLLPILKKYISR